jgi:hypothetical protein
MSERPDPVRLLTSVVLPAGVGIIAFVQTAGAPAATQWALVTVAALTLFVAFNRTLAIVDDCYNGPVEAGR